MTSADAPRHDGRRPHDLRGIEITRGFTEAAPGSVLYRCGRTLVFVTASIEERVPGWMMGRGKGWLTAEYSMLPGSGTTRKPRDRGTGRVDGRTHEIQRLVGRALRSVTDLAALGERTVWLDCDVLQADGGTRTAAITGACVAAHDAFSRLVAADAIPRHPLRELVAAISVGIYDGTPVLDLDYPEDSACDTDMNVVMTASGGMIEVQGTAEGVPFTRNELDLLLGLAERGIAQLVAAQKAALEEP